MVLVVLLIVLLYGLWQQLSSPIQSRCCARRSLPGATRSLSSGTEFIQPPKAGRRFRKKPAWVPKAIIRLKALCPNASLRDIQQQFNRREAQRSGESVSHQYVGYTLQAHQYQVAILARELHNRRPRPVPLHRMWAADLTFLPNKEGKPHPVLGIIEHASRASLILMAIRVKTSVTLLRALADAIEQAQALPKVFKTDNEVIFTSRTFRLGLWLCGIRHRTTEVGSPWQNGKMERFFGTFKQKARGLVFHTREELNTQLAVFRFWYNHIHTHGYLDYKTPFEAYHNWGIQYAKPEQAEPLFLEAWIND